MRTLRSAVNYDAALVSRGTAVYTQDESAPRFAPSRTVQSAKADSDINVIVKRFRVTGQMPGSFRMPQYGDYEGVNDFQSAMNALRAAEEGFAQLPADVRKKFGNDPQNFLDFVSNPENADAMVELGLATKRSSGSMSSSADGPPEKEKVNARDFGKRVGKVGKAVVESDGDSGSE